MDAGKEKEATERFAKRLHDSYFMNAAHEEQRARPLSFDPVLGFEAHLSRIPHQPPQARTDAGAHGDVDVAMRGCCAGKRRPRHKHRPYNIYIYIYVVFCVGRTFCYSTTASRKVALQSCDTHYNVGRRGNKTKRRNNNKEYICIDRSIRDGRHRRRDISIASRVCACVCL